MLPAGGVAIVVRMGKSREEMSKKEREIEGKDTFLGMGKGKWVGKRGRVGMDRVTLARFQWESHGSGNLAKSKTREK